MQKVFDAMARLGEYYCTQAERTVAKLNRWVQSSMVNVSEIRYSLYILSMDVSHVMITMSPKGELLKFRAV